MKLRVISSFVIIVIIVIILTIGCEEKSKEEIVTPNTEKIEYLKFKDKGCQSTLMNEYPSDKNGLNRQLQILTNSSKNEGNFWEIIGDSLIITASLNTYCNAELKDSIEVTENEIQIFIEDVAKNIVRCSCTFEEEFSFRAESPKTIEVIIYFKSNGSVEYKLLGKSTIKI